MTSATPSAEARRFPVSRLGEIDWSIAVFVALLWLGAVIVVVEMRDFSFFQDEWGFLAGRLDWTPSAFFHPNGPQLFAFPVLVFKVMLSVFGATSYRPWIALAAIDQMLLAGAVGVVTRSFWGRWWGLVPVAVMVTLGPAARTILWPFQVTLAVASAAGILALALAVRGSRRADVLACALLVLAIITGGQGVGLLVGVAVVIAISKERLKRAWVVGIPAFLYILWYVIYKPNSQTHLSLLPHVPIWVLRAYGATVGATFGLAPPQLDGTVVSTAVGIPLGLALLVVALAAFVRGWRPPRFVLGVVAALIVLWVTAALSNATGDRPPNTERYVAVDVALLLVGLCAATPAPRLGRLATVAVLVIVAAICVRNATEFSAERHHFLSPAVVSRAELGALLIARDVVDPHLKMPDGPPGALLPIPAGDYLRMMSTYGTNALSAAQILQVGSLARQAADVMLIRTERVLLAPTSPSATGTSAPSVLAGTARQVGPCVVLRSPAKLRPPSGGIRVDAPPGAQATVRVERFSSPSIAIGVVPAASAAALAIPVDLAPQVPWNVVVDAPGSRICGLR